MSYGDAFTEDTISDHGHVYPREDGTKKECGGPRHCRACRADLVSSFEAGAAGRAHNAVNSDVWGTLDEMMGALRPQLLMYLVRKLAPDGRLAVPVDDLDANRGFMMGVEPGPDLRSLIFTLQRKS